MRSQSVSAMIVDLTHQPMTRSAPMATLQLNSRLRRRPAMTVAMRGAPMVMLSAMSQHFHGHSTSMA